ncbi:hypothetical protein [Arenimonas fontis]|uniref:SH3 domain-containing protein n=1 Tax=Arenimonas fontis TaxID=2608255 RepID=A0A5B2Z7N4_9GAMM|nr:hypothetical protein [Arenimonas fontis]KAA2284196.1 hypothetical protein F0415_10635 [Arenimonas fontis]
MPRWIWLFLAIAVAALLWAASRGPTTPVAADAGAERACLAVPREAVALGRPPHQSSVPGGVGPFRHGEFTLAPLAGFALEARVLGREDYRFDREAALSPTDLALGWGAMADPQVYDRLDISQSGRWYRYRWGAEGPPIPAHEIVRSSANMHMIPADSRVAAALSRVRQGQTVRLRGWLIEAGHADGYRWRSSLSREDSGDGACELIFVCELEAY